MAIPAYSLSELEDILNEWLGMGRFDEALQLVHIGFEAETRYYHYHEWYLKMIELATMAHQAGAYQPKAILFRSRWGGLCNRLFSLATAHSYSQLLGCELHICWTPDDQCNGKLDELVKLPGASVLDVPGALELMRQGGTKTAWTGVFGADHHIYGLLPLAPEQAQRIDASSDQFIQGLDFSEVIQARVREFMLSHGWDESVIGVHVRGTDHAEYFAEQGQVHELSSDEGFRAKIDPLIGQGCSRFYLATDCLETLHKFQAWYGDRVFTRVKRYDAGQLRQTSIEDALIDVVLLSKAQKIVGSKLSTFGYFASILGNIEFILA